jgi:hypothetical protein
MIRDLVEVQVWFAIEKKEALHTIAGAKDGICELMIQVKTVYVKPKHWRK